MTPANWAFSIWAAIYTLEIAYVVTSYFKAFRSSLLNPASVAKTFILTNVLSAVWTLVFSLDKQALAFIAIASILVTLLVIVSKQLKIIMATSSDVKIFEFVFLALPFQMHAGWLVSATNVNLSVLLTSLSPNDASALNTSDGFSLLTTDNATMQVSLAVLSIAIIIFSCLYSIFVVPAYTIALVGAWTFLGIADKLSSPPADIKKTFDSMTLSGLQGAAQVGGYGVLAAVVLKIAWGFVISRCARSLAPRNSSQGRIRQPSHAVSMV